MERYFPDSSIRIRPVTKQHQDYVPAAEVHAHGEAENSMNCMRPVAVQWLNGMPATNWNLFENPVSAGI